MDSETKRDKKNFPVKVLQRAQTEAAEEPRTVNFGVRILLCAVEWFGHPPELTTDQPASGTEITPFKRTFVHVQEVQESYRPAPEGR